MVCLLEDDHQSIYQASICPLLYVRISIHIYIYIYTHITYIYIYLQHQGIQNFSRWLEQQKKQSLLEKNVLDGEKHRLALMPFTAPPAACASSRL